MPTELIPEKKSGVSPPKSQPADKNAAKEALREQAKTETETRPYLDTEGGE